MIIDSLDAAWGICIFDSSLGSITNNSYGLVQLSKVSGDKKGKRFVVCDYPEAVTYKNNNQTTDTCNITNYIDANLDSTGATDCTATLQNILNNASSDSVVYIKAGNYRFDGRITVPKGIEIRGFSPIAQRDNAGESGGTYFLCYYGDDDESSFSDPAFITMNSGSGLCGIKILYPENQPKETNLNTTFAIRRNGSDIYLLNCSISSSYYGVDFRNCDNHFIKQVCCCCYKNTFLLGGQNGTITDCLQNGTVIIRSANPAIQNKLNESEIFTDLFEPILRKQADFIILDSAENETIFNVFCYGCNRFLTCRNNSTADALNVGADNLGATMFTIENSKLRAMNIMRYNGSAYRVEEGSIMLWNRISHGLGAESSVLL